MPTARTDLSSIVLKVGMVGDAQIGKTSLMVKYVEGSFEYVLANTRPLTFL
jgi:GTP-binding protein of the ras superfamily involved in termination of M-phase